MALTGTHVVGDPGEVADNNLRDVAIIKAAADIATLQTTTVRLTGVQTIDGAKDFTTAPTVNGVPIGGPPVAPLVGPVFTASTPPTTATVGTLYLYQFAATGNPTFTVTSGQIPTGTTLTAGGLLSGTPTTGGAVSFTVNASNGTAPDASASCTVTINPGTTPPAFTAAIPPGGTVGTPYSYQFAASGSAPITFTISVGAVPAGLTLSAAGLLAGTPTTAATSTFTVTATNSVAAVASSPKTVTMAAAGGGSPAWRGDYQTSLLMGWQPDQQLVRAAQQSIVTNPARAGYPNTGRFIVAHGDYTNGGTTEERSEVYASIADSGTPANGQTMWWAWSVYLPVGFQVDSDAESLVGNGWLVFGQWHIESGTGGGGLGLDMTLTKGTSAPQMVVGSAGSIWVGANPFPLGQWVDLAWGVTWGDTSTVGRLTVKQNGVTLVNNVATQTLQPGQTAYFKQGIYRSTSNRTHTAYYTGTRRGPTEASVTL